MILRVRSGKNIEANSSLGATLTPYHNNMTTQISFKLAKLLKEKDYPFEFITIGELKEVPLNIPTIAEVIMWLHEKYRVWISVDPENDTDTWFHTISHNKSGTVFGDYNSPTEAYEAAIEYCLRNLI